VKLESCEICGRKGGGNKRANIYHESWERQFLNLFFWLDKANVDRNPIGIVILNRFLIPCGYSRRSKNLNLYKKSYFPYYYIQNYIHEMFFCYLK